jgi:hypothetical protein
VGSTVQMVELRPIGLDTVPMSEVVVTNSGRTLFGDRAAVCISGDLCTVYRTLPEVWAVAATQDVSLTGWGLGVQGLSVTTLLRARASLGSDFLWPRADDEFDLMLGYAQLHRGTMRFRLGRQEVRSGLGFPAFDGAFGSVALGRFDLEGYGGRSMARGLREPANEALRGIEAFLPDESVYLIGTAARWRVEGTAVTARYHREILADRSGLVSERASIDFSSSSVPGARVTGSMDYDFGFGRFGKSHLTLAAPLGEGHWLVEASGRRYVPYFELSTIWGFFEPVAYSEVETRVGWSPSSNFATWVSGGWRSYGAANTTVVVEPLTDEGWRASAGTRWHVREEWQLEAGYRLEWGPGAFLSSGDVSARYHPSERLSLTVTGTTFQQIEEFRIGDGRAIGGGFSFDVGVTDGAHLSGGLSVLRHRSEGVVNDSPWNQTRGWTGLRIEVGGDPGLSSRRRP